MFRDKRYEEAVVTDAKFYLDPHCGLTDASVRENTLFDTQTSIVRLNKKQVLRQGLQKYVQVRTHITSVSRNKHETLLDT